MNAMKQPFFRSFCDKRGDHHFRRECYDLAAKWYQRADNHERAGDALFALGAYAEALAQFSVCGQNRKAADCALALKDYEAAAGHLIFLGEIESAARVFFDADDADRGIRVYLEHGLAGEAADECARRGLFSRADTLYLEQGQTARAFEMLRKAGNEGDFLAIYRKRGDLLKAAEECEAHEEPMLAAALFEDAGQMDRAAELLLAAGHEDRARDLFASAGNYDAVARIYLKARHLEQAAAAYEQAPGKELEAAKIYETLTVLQPLSETSYRAGILCGSFSRDGSAAALGASNGSILYTDDGLETLWTYHLGGERHATSISISDKGSFVVAGIQSFSQTDGLLHLLTRGKEEVWQKSLPDVVRDVAFLPGEAEFALALGDRISVFSVQGEMAWERKLDFRSWAVDVSADGGRILAGTIGGGVFLFSKSGEPIGEFHFDERVHDARFSPDGCWILAAVGDSRIALLDGKLRKQWECRIEGLLRSVYWMGDGIAVAAAGQSLVLLNQEGSIMSSQEAGKKIHCCFQDISRGILYAGIGGGTGPASGNGESRGAECAVRGFGGKDCLAKAAECYRRAGRLGDAAALFRRIGEHSKAYDLYREVGDFESAAAVVQSSGDNLTAARHYEVVGRYEEAARLYEEMGSKNQAAQCYSKGGHPLRAAQLYEELGRLILAADCYEKAGEHRKAGLLFMKANQTEQAIATLEASGGGAKGDVEVIGALADLYFSSEQYDSSIRMLQQLTDDPNHRQNALQKLGECFLKKKIHDVAIDRLMEAIGDVGKATRENLNSFYTLGLTYESAGRYAEAKETFGKVMAVDYYYKDIQERLRRAEELTTMQAQSGLGSAATRGIRPPSFSTDATVIGSGPGPRGQRYQIIQKLGEGGMGVVYLARDTVLDRQVAWKVLPLHLTANSEMQQRLLREARAAARLSSRYIVSVYDISTDEGECSITMEYIDGTTLRKRMSEEPRMALGDLVRYGLQMSEALREAHKASIIHRDVKPENILIDKANDDIHMADFGLARISDDVQLTKEGCVVGTLRYMAPEQIRATGVDHRVDIYAFGVIMFEMAAGRAPFVDENVLAQHLHKDPPLLSEFCEDAPAGLVRLVARCLEKDKEKRPADFEEIWKELGRIQADVPDGRFRI